MNENKPSGTILVEIDRELQPIIPDFLNKRQRDRLMIAHLLEEGSFAEIRTLGHHMKGAGGSFGFDEISELGEIIENAALEADVETIYSAVERLSDYLERVTVEYITET